MAYACDICLRVCHPPELAVLSGWWGREEVYPATARKAASCRRVPLSAEASVEGHICRRCMEERLSTDIRLNQEKPREVLQAERRKAFPKESAIENLRKTIFWVGGISCDRCESECYERHVEVRSEWLDAERSHQVFHLCDHCYGSDLRPLLKTEASEAVL